MMGKIFSTVIVAFWLTMMVALVRTEMWPQSSLNAVSQEEIMRKVFAHDAPARLNIFYRGQEIGYCRVDVEPQYAAVDAAAQTETRVPSRFQVRTDVKIKLTPFRVASTLHLRGASEFSARYELERFDLNTLIADSIIRVRGDQQSGKVKVDFRAGDREDHREFDFKQLQGAGLASAVGLPGLANFSFLGGGGMPTAFGAGGDRPATATMTTTRAFRDHLKIGGSKIRAYQVASEFGDGMWMKMWIDEESGSVLKVDTSIGLKMIQDELATGTGTF